MITAAQSEQEVWEGYNNHGFFTYVLLEGIRGKADKTDYQGKLNKERRFRDRK